MKEYTPVSDNSKTMFIVQITCDIVVAPGCLYRDFFPQSCWSCWALWIRCVQCKLQMVDWMGIWGVWRPGQLHQLFVASLRVLLSSFCSVVGCIDPAEGGSRNPNFFFAKQTFTYIFFFVMEYCSQFM